MKHCLRNILTFCAICNFPLNSAFAKPALPDLIIGGQTAAPYAAFLKDGVATPISGLPATGVTFRVAINSTGEALIGGTDNVNAYAALVTSNGTLLPLPGLIAPGEIYNVAINESNMGIIGGGHLISNVPYAALVNRYGVTPLAVPASGLIYGVAIDNSGEGIIGGIGPLNSAYAALTHSNGSLTPLAGLPLNGGIFWVSTNQTKTRFIGGNESTSIYAAYVNPNGSVAPIVNLPVGQLYSVGINTSGSAIMGGEASNLPYAALVAPDGSVNTLVGLPTNAGIIYNTAINDSGTGLIAGNSTSGAYGSFVSPTGTLIPLEGLPIGANGFLDGAALHSTGVGIVGGTTSAGTPFLALAAPNGTLTYLDGLPANGEINSIAIRALEGLVPSGTGAFSSFINTQFTFTNALTNHCVLDRMNLFKNTFYPYIEDYCEDPYFYKRDCNEDSSLWLSVVGNYICEKSRHAIPGFSNEILGAIVGFDYTDVEDVVVGAALAYAYNKVDYRKNLGCSSINQESAVVYATFDNSEFYVNGALWGGLFQASNKRQSFSLITSKSRPTGWNFCPHLELGAPFALNLCQTAFINPFVAMDWANVWQKNYSEHGSSGFNLRLKDQHAGIFRTEVGFRFFESFDYDGGQLIFVEKISYVNRTPLFVRNGNASFVGAFSSFEIEAISPCTQNLGVLQLHLECIPAGLRNFYASFDYQGEFGTSYLSNALTFSIGKNF